MTRRPPHRSRRAVFPHRAPRWDALPHSQMSGRRLSPSGRLAWGLRPCMAGPRVLGRRRPTVTPFPVWTALPPSAYSGVIRLPVDQPPPSLQAGGPPCCQESMGSPTFSTLLSLHARPCGPRQTLRPLAVAIPLSGLPMRENRRRLPSCLHEAVPDFRGCGHPAGLQSARWTLPRMRSVSSTSSTDATRGTGGWRDLPWQGLAPCKKRQASLGALTPGMSRARKRERSGRWRASAPCLR